MKSSGFGSTMYVRADRHLLIAHCSNMHFFAFLFAVVLPLQCSSAAPTNIPSDSEKLDLNAIGAVVEFGLKNALHVQSSYGLAIDGNLGVGWTECAASNFADKTEFWIDLRGIYPVDRVSVLSRHHYAAGAEVFVGNFSAAEKRPTQFQCGGKFPSKASKSFTEFRCSTTLWIRYIQIRKFANREKPSRLPMQICEIEVNHTG